MPRDGHGSYIAAKELPAGVRPPYQVATAWEGDHRGWRITVTRLEGDPAPHVVASGVHPATGLVEAHAERMLGATPAIVKAWVDSLLAATDRPAEPAVGAA